MVEIVFSDSACGCLKFAQSFGKGEYKEFGIGIILSFKDGHKPTKEEIEEAKRKAQQEERIKWEKAVPLGGSPKDVYGFSLNLSMGDISQRPIGDERVKSLAYLYNVYPDAVGEDTADTLNKAAKENLEAVIRRAEGGEGLRIWYSNHPDELCGLYWFMSELGSAENYKGQIFTVKLPEQEYDEEKNTSIRYTAWGEVAPEQWHRYLCLQESATPSFCDECISEWERLKKENAPLRAVLNRKVTSVDEDYYDSYILKEIEAESEEFNEAMIIGRVLGKYQLGIGDSLIAHRIEKMIEKGSLEAVTKAPEGMPIYHRRLRKRF